MRQDQRYGQNEYDENRGPPALAITTLERPKVGGNVLDGMSRAPEEIAVNVSNVPQLQVYSKQFFEQNLTGV